MGLIIKFYHHCFLLIHKILVCFVILQNTYSAEHNCDRCQYGYRRAFAPQAIIKTSDTQEWDAEGLFFQDVAEKAESLRAMLIENGVFGTPPKERAEEKQSKIKRNIASFGYVFFNQEGTPIGEHPFFYRPDAKKDNILTPYFFFSGRAQRTYQPTDSYGWSALGEAAIKEEDSKLLDMPQASMPRMNRFKEILGDHYVGVVQRLETQYISEIKTLVWLVCHQDPFFDHLETRRKTTDDRDGDGETCVNFLKPTLLNMRDIKPTSHVPSKVSHYLPLLELKDADSKKADTKGMETAAMYFTHSEQYALHKMSKDFETFVKVCKEFLKDKSDSVSKVAILIYSRNTMCVRCAHSVIVDFCLSGDRSLLLTLTNNFPQRLQYAFLASARHPYQSTIEKKDNFEQVLSKVNATTLEAGSSFVQAVSKVDLKDFKPDFTMNSELLRISFEEEPKVIYHHHMDGHHGLPASQSYKQPSVSSTVSDVGVVPSKSSKSPALVPPDLSSPEQLRLFVTSKFLNPDNDATEIKPFALFKVNYRETKPPLPGLCDVYIIGPAIGDGDCFFHATFTKAGQNVTDIEKFSREYREILQGLIISKPEYLEIMRSEVLVEMKNPSSDFKKRNELKALCEKLDTNTRHEVAREYLREHQAATLSHQTYKKPFHELAKDQQDLVSTQVLADLPALLKTRQRYSDDELKLGISDDTVKDYVKRYIRNNGEPSCYIECPVGRGSKSSIADVIAENKNLLIHCFSFDSTKRELNYSGCAGNPTSPTVVSILYRPGHYWTLFDQSMQEERKGGIIQAAINKHSFSGTFE